MRPLSALALSLALGSAGTAWAGDDLTISAAATVTSDYRSRGISQSDRHPAATGGVTLALASGPCVDVWAAALGDEVAGSHEVDLTAGWSGRLGWADINAGVTYGSSSGPRGGDWEFFASATLPFGPLRSTLGAAYAPPQDSISGDNVYVHGDVSAAIPRTPVTVRAGLGYEKGGLTTIDSYGRVGKWNWLLGADYYWRGLLLGVAWSANDLPRARAPSAYARRVARGNVVASLTIGF